MSEKRRGLGRGLGALIPTEGSGGRSATRPSDVFFQDRQAAASPTASPTGEALPASTAPAGELSSDRPVPRPSVAHGALDAPGVRPSDDGDGLQPVPGASFTQLPLDAIRPNARQPRTVFDDDELGELAHSIREIGVLQPVVVRRIENAAAGDAVGADAVGDDEARYELVMGERRWRASRLAGRATIPAIVKDTADDAMLRDALLENLHRSQLNPLEEAAAYQQLLDDFGCTHEELASRIGRSRPQISNVIRLLKLPPVVARRVAAGVLSAGHARALLGLEDAAAMERLAQRIVAEGLSVRSVEEIVALGEADTRPTRSVSRGDRRMPELDDLAAVLADRWDTRVNIAMGRKKGKLTVEFASVEDLNRILGAIGETDGSGLTTLAG